jgi:hypothetical protein
VGPHRMGTNETETSPELRDKTDESLKDERGKTDEILIRKSKTVEKETIEIIRVNRLAADTDRESLRAESDIDETEHRLAETGVQPSQLDDERLFQERERSDKAQSVERGKEDRARENERVQKRLISEAVLERERKETDRNLLEERGRLDIESAHKSALLSHEKVSHRRTKTALVTRDQFIGILIRERMQAMGGRLGVESVVGQGSTLTLILPLGVKEVRGSGDEVTMARGRR